MQKDILGSATPTELDDSLSSISEVQTSEVGGTPQASEAQPPAEAVVEAPAFKAEPNANVKLSSDGQALNPGPVMIGKVKVILPEEGQQRAGFHVPAKKAGHLITQYQQYKYLRAKGSKDNVPTAVLE